MSKIPLELPDNLLNDVEEFCSDNELDFDKLVEFLLRIEINQDHRFGHKRVLYGIDATDKGIAKEKARTEKIEASRKLRIDK